MTEERPTTLARLIERWPKCFSATAPRPLKVGIATDITSSRGVGKVGRPEAIRAALGEYVATEAYLRAMTKGAARINLSGDAVGTVNVDRAMKSAGMRGARHISVMDHPWKDADARWFELHPRRSHRARAAHPGERIAAKDDYELPPDHEVLMLIRQVEPGKRMKLAYAMPTKLLPMPDEEELIHAMFDLVARGTQVKLRELCELRDRYKRAR
jgi:sRNA-binding protein